MTTAFARPSVLMFGAALALSACDTADHFDRDPQPSPIVVDGQAIPEVARVQVPMPAVAMEPPRRGSAKASLFTARSQPLFSDQRADDIGDIVTVVISIDDRAQLRNSTDREREGGKLGRIPDILWLWRENCRNSARNQRRRSAERRYRRGRIGLGGQRVGCHFAQ